MLETQKAGRKGEEVSEERAFESVQGPIGMGKERKSRKNSPIMTPMDLPLSENLMSRGR